MSTIVNHDADEKENTHKSTSSYDDYESSDSVDYSELDPIIQAEIEYQHNLLDGAFDLLFDPDVRAELDADELDADELAELAELEYHYDFLRGIPNESRRPLDSDDSDSQSEANSVN